MQRALVSLAVVALASRTAAAQPSQPEPPPDTADPCDGGEVAPIDADQPAPAPDPDPTPAPTPPTVAPAQSPPQLRAVDEPPVVGPPEHHLIGAGKRGDRDDAGFSFGSYGRVLAGSDLRGGKPEPVAVVGHGPRIVENSYLELDFQYRMETKRGRSVRTVTTLAFDDTLFHDTGEFDAQPALRNFFLEVELSERLTAWGGSRMYRGDDIYLFDFWPLDDQNTVGAGARFRGGRHADEPWFVSAHVGWNRLLDDFQFQEIAVPDPEQGATTVTQLNRQRTIASATFEYEIVPNGPADLNLTGKLHGEFHALPSGTRRREADGTFEALPRDTGYTIGAELIAFGMAPSRFEYKRHANLFARYSRGLAAFDELAPPTSFDSELKTTRASEFVVGLSANWDHALGHVLFGALTRRVIDADRNDQDVDDGWEYAVNARPLLRAPIDDLFVGLDLSYQVRFPRGLNPTSQRASDPAIVMFAPMVVWSPMGGSGYDRPQLRAVYRAARLNEGARDLYAPDDPRRAREWVHFLGIQAEWWFNSASYR